MFQENTIPSCDTVHSVSLDTLIMISPIMMHCHHFESSVSVSPVPQSTTITGLFTSSIVLPELDFECLPLKILAVVLL